MKCVMLQLNPTIPVYCKKHGDGEAIIVIDYGPDVNTVWAVRFPGGVVKHFYSDDVLVLGNPMDGNGYDVSVPIDWYPELKGVRKDNRHIKNQRKVKK